jgi:hypothetical protein
MFLINCDETHTKNNERNTNLQYFRIFATNIAVFLELGESRLHLNILQINTKKERDKIQSVQVRVLGNLQANKRRPEQTPVTFTVFLLLPLLVGDHPFDHVFGKFGRCGGVVQHNLPEPIVIKLGQHLRVHDLLHELFVVHGFDWFWNVLPTDMSKKNLEKLMLPKSLFFSFFFAAVPAVLYNSSIHLRCHQNEPKLLLLKECKVHCSRSTPLDMSLTK